VWIWRQFKETVSSNYRKFSLFENPNTEMYQIYISLPLSGVRTRCLSLNEQIQRYFVIWHPNRIKIESDTVRARARARARKTNNILVFNIEKIVLFYFVSQLSPKRTTTCALPCTGGLHKKLCYMGLSLRPPKPKKKCAPLSRTKTYLSCLPHAQWSLYLSRIHIQAYTYL